MNNNQKIFTQVTGFEASYKACGASQDYDESDRGEIEAVVSATIEHADYYDIALDEGDIDEERITDAIVAYHACDSGRGVDLDRIVSAL